VELIPNRVLGEAPCNRVVSLYFDDALQASADLRLKGHQGVMEFLLLSVAN
jgi:hypothetical protein